MNMVKVLVAGAALYYVTDMVQANASIQSALGTNAKYAPYIVGGLALLALAKFAPSMLHAA